MGKSKNKRHKTPKSQPTGLPSVKEAEAEFDEMASSSSTSTTGGAERISNTVLNLMEKLQSPSADERECACSTIANLVSQPGSIQQFLQADTVKILGPMLLDPSFGVRTTALGALRNMSVEGGVDVCERMVEQDVMTSVIALLQQFGQEWKPTAAQSSAEKTNPQNEAFLQLVHLLWNLCESSEVAVKVCNQQNVLRLLWPRLQPDTHSYTLVLAVAQCLQTLTDNNPQSATVLCSTEFGGLGALDTLLNTTHSSMAQLLLRTLAASLAYNATGGQVSQVSASLLEKIIQLLAEVLQHDIVTHLQCIMELLQQSLAQVSSATNGDTVPTEAEICSDTPQESDLVKPDGEMDTTPAVNGKSAVKKSPAKKAPSEQQIKCRLIDDKLEEAEHLLSAQLLALQLLTNLCYCEDGDGEAWDDCDSSDNSLEEVGDADMDTAEQPQASLCVPSEVHTAFVSHQIIEKVVSKTVMPSGEHFNKIAEHDRGPKLLKSLESIQKHALLCVGNMVGSMEVEALGGQVTLHQLWERLGTLITTKTVLENAEQLEAATTALRAIVCKLGELHSPKLSEVTQNDLIFLFDLGKSCAQAEVRANVVKVVSTVGCELARQPVPHCLLKPIGEFLLAVVEKDTELWVVGEALDSIFDVYADDHTDPVLKDLDLVPRLRTVTPVLKTKIRQQKRHLGEHLAIISTAKTNLVRFIKYKSARIPSE